MSRPLTRRDFLRRSAVLAATLPLSRWRVETRAPLVLRIGVVSSSSDAWRRHRLGIDLGVDEAKHAAQLFGGTIELATLSTLTDVDRQLSALIGGEDARVCASYAQRADAMGLVYMNVACATDDLRGANCARAMFHVVPSETMYRDAVAMAGIASGVATAWDASLSRFGADTLNQRFRARFNEPMTAESWTGWMAVKILWESALRQKAADGAALASFLARETTQFDGHKGQPLSFRPWDHQLRQPIYVVKTDASGARTVKEVPETIGGDSVRDALDRLGTTKASSTCRLP